MVNQRLRLIELKLSQAVKMIDDELEITYKSQEQSVLQDASLAVANAGELINLLREKQEQE